MAEVNHATLMDVIIQVHGPADPAWIRFWSDVYDGRAWRVFPAFWQVLQAREHEGSALAVVSAWERDELTELYRGLLWVRLPAS